MNPVEIEEAVSQISSNRFDAVEFPFEFLLAFGRKSTTIKKLRSGVTNKSDVGGVLQRNNIHIATCIRGEIDKKLEMLKQSKETTKSKAKFILATDGEDFISEDLNSGEILSCSFKDIVNHFGFFLPLAGIETTKNLRENSFDIRATSRLNKLYIELLNTNPEWGDQEKKQEMNHFMTRLIFCFFAEDTDIFGYNISFTKTIEEMTIKDSSNTHNIIERIFQVMNIPFNKREKLNLPTWAKRFPYVNGGLFTDNVATPKFSKIARSYLINIGNLDWKKINPDIFGSMIQAVADEDERSFLGMHYTSVPNILKLLNPLFLDELKVQLESSKNNHKKLLNLRKRISKIRVFDPACGSGNFLVIAYKEMRKIENDINNFRNEIGRKSEIPLTNFRGIEVRNFSSEIARLALIIAEYQCNVNYLGQKEALDEFLPLESKNWITCGNALRLDWSKLCPPSGKSSNYSSYELLASSPNQSEIEFVHEGGEVFICGNPPYLGSQRQTSEQKEDLEIVFGSLTKNFKSLDYVSGWFLLASIYLKNGNSSAAFVSTNSICQGRQVGTLWKLIEKNKAKIFFAHQSFKWSNLASHNAGVTVAIIGLSNILKKQCSLYFQDEKKMTVIKKCENINPYLISGPNIIVEPQSKPLNQLPLMSFGNMPNDGGNLLLNISDTLKAINEFDVNKKFIKRFLGSEEFINGKERRCIWISDDEYEEAKDNEWLNSRFNLVEEKRLKSDRETSKELAKKPYRFGEVRQKGINNAIIVPRVSSENRDYLPVGYLSAQSIVSDAAFVIDDAPLWSMAIIASKLHLVWIATVCGRIKTDFRYSNTLGWNTFPIPYLTDKNKMDLTSSAEDILIAREIHFPKSIADLYDSEQMPTNLRNAHQKNDEILERIFIGRCFRNNSERIEKLFDLYCNNTKKI